MPMKRAYPPDLRYSDWHRSLDPSLGLIDLDAIECCSSCWSPVAVMELTRWGSCEKNVTTTRRLAELAGLPAFLVRHEFPETVAPIRLSVRQLGSDGPARVLSPEEYERFLFSLRSTHRCGRD